MALVTAAIIGAVATTGASVYSANKAAGASEDATDASLALQQQQFETVRQDTAPYRASGYNALNLLNQMVGLPAVETPDAYGGGSIGGRNRQYGGREGYEEATQGLSPIGGATWRGRPVFTDGKGGIYTVRGRDATVGSAGVEFIGQAGEGPAGMRFDGTRIKAGQGVLDYRDGQFYAGRGRRAPAIDVAAPTPIEASEQPQAAVASGNALSPEEIMKRDPGYQFRLNEGMRAIDRYRSAKGGSLGGGALREITRYGQGYASNEYQNMYNRVSNIAGLGQVGVSQSNQAAMNYGNAGTSAIISGGDTRASAYTAMGNSIGQGISDIAGAYGYSSALRQPTASNSRTPTAVEMMYWGR